MCCTDFRELTFLVCLLVCLVIATDCSRECQILDWKRGHKNVCARLAKERKDKEKISQMAKR